jgi:SAM-dependent methyltransferase
MVLAAEYVAQFRGLERFFNAYRPNICPFEALVDAVPNASEVFDIGCGTGLFLYILRAEGKLSKGIGLDIDADRLSKGRGALGRLMPPTSIYNAYWISQTGHPIILMSSA